MFAKRYTWTIILFFLVTIVTARENYIDYGNESPNNEPSIRDLYRWLMQRSIDELGGLSAEQFQPSPAERSPTLRLRYGRSSPLSPKYTRSTALRLRYGRSVPVIPYGLISRLTGDSTGTASAQQDN